MSSKEIALLSAQILNKKKALDIAVIDIGTKSSFADYLVLASGGSERQIGSLLSELSDQFAKDGIFIKGVEGKQTSGWILMDMGDVVINLMTVEMRERYSIERVWGDCDFLDWEEGNEQ